VRAVSGDTLRDTVTELVALELALEAQRGIVVEPSTCTARLGLRWERAMPSADGFRDLRRRRLLRLTVVRRAHRRRAQLCDSCRRAERVLGWTRRAGFGLQWGRCAQGKRSKIELGRATRRAICRLWRPDRRSAARDRAGASRWVRSRAPTLGKEKARQKLAGLPF